MKERRGQKRFRRRFMVRYGERELSHTGFTQDVSRGGAFIVSPYRPPLDAHLHVQVYLDNETSVYFEALVRRHKIIPPELRSLEKGGFGVRFLLPDELLADILVESGDHREINRGGEVIFAMRLGFAGKTFEFETTVVHVFQDGGAQQGRRGVGLVFRNRKEVEEAIAPYLAQA